MVRNCGHWAQDRRLFQQYSTRLPLPTRHWRLPLAVIAGRPYNSDACSFGEEESGVRYLVAAKLRPEKRSELFEALERGCFGADFPYGDLGDVLRAGRVDASGTIRWVEVCYCREFAGVALEEELPYFEEFLTDITIADARNPRLCEGYPVCNDCACSNKVCFLGEPFDDYLRRSVVEPETSGPSLDGSSTRWLGWRGQVTPEEAERNGSPVPGSSGGEA
jgi:hypothetical protein